MQLPIEQFSSVVVVTPKVLGDSRGYFLETYQQQRYQQLGIKANFVQDNVSRSSRGTLRGLHYQLPHPQGKLCYVVRGEVLDVFVDLRSDSPTFGHWGSIVLSESNHQQIFIPSGFAHGFCVTSETADFVYKCTDYYHRDSEQTLLWNDSSLKIAWPVDQPQISEKDSRGLPWHQIRYF